MMRQNDKKLGRWSVRMDKIELPSLWKYFIKPNVWDHFRHNLYHPSDLWVKYLFVKIWSKFVWFYGEVCKCLSFKGKNRNLKQICVVVYGEVCKCLSFKGKKKLCRGFSSFHDCHWESNNANYPILVLSLVESSWFG